jgi:TonB family protein
MELTRQEINRNRTISATVTVMIFFLFILFLILFKLITPNPPFPESGGGGGQELALGLMSVGNDDLDYGDMGKVTDVVAEKTEPAEKIVTSEEGEDVQISEAKTPEKETKMVITPKPKEQIEVKPREKTAAEKLREKVLKNTGKTGGGVGNNQTPGESGSPDGDPFKNGTGGTGTGDGGGNGPGVGPGSGPGFGGGKYGIDLKGRAVVRPPKLPSDTQEEGKVVVEITVDSEGNVTEANPNGRGTTTSSAMLKAKARQAAMQTKFNVDGKFEEQKGTITIIFSYN